MKLKAQTAAAGTFAGAAQGAANEIWQHYAAPVFPGLAGPMVSVFFGVCVFIIASHLIPDE